MSSVGGECGAKSGQPVDLSVDGDAVFQEWPPHSFSLASQVTDTEHETGEALTREVETTLQLSHLTPDSPSGWMSLPTDAAEHDTRWKVQFRCAVAGDVGVELRCASVRSIQQQFDCWPRWLTILTTGWRQLLFSRAATLRRCLSCFRSCVLSGAGQRDGGRCEFESSSNSNMKK